MMIQEELSEGVDGINGLESDGSILGPQQVRAKDYSQVSVGHLVLVTMGRYLWKKMRITARIYGPGLLLPATTSRASKQKQHTLSPHQVSSGGQGKSHLHQESSQETKHLVVLLWQSLERLLCYLHSLAFINVCEEWRPRLRGIGLAQETLIGD